MRFMECLNQSDMSQLIHIAKNHDIKAPTYSKNAILQELLSKFSEPDYLKERVSQSEISLQTVIRELVISGRDRYAKDELSPFIRRILSTLHMEKNTSQDVILALNTEGLLFEMQSTYGKVYIFPEDLWKKIHHILTSERRCSTLSQIPLIIRDDGTTIARDAAALLFFCAKNPQRLTTDGSLYKRSQQQLMQLFEISEELLPDRPGWRFGFHSHYRNYPERLAILYEFWSKSGVWKECNGELHVEEGVGQALLMIKEEKRTELIFRFYMQVYRSAIPHLFRIINKIGEMTRESWVPEEQIEQEIAPWVADYFYESKENMIKQHIIYMLIFLGFLKQGEFGDSIIGYQLSNLGECWLGPHGFTEQGSSMDSSEESEDHYVTITPDFSIIVPSRAESLYGFTLQKIAKLVKNQRVRIFQLTRGSIRHALACGWTKDQLVAFLRQISREPIPTNIEILLSEWCESDKQKEFSKEGNHGGFREYDVIN